MSKCGLSPQTHLTLKAISGHLAHIQVATPNRRSTRLRGTQPSPSEPSRKRRRVVSDTNRDMGVVAEGSKRDGAGTSQAPSLYKDEDLVRIITQSLYSMGYRNAANTLEKDAGVLVQPPTITRFRDSVLKGDWSTAESLLPELQIDSQDEVRTVRFLLLEQKYLEYVEQGKAKEALSVLRNELAPLKRDSMHLHKLSSYMMCTESDDLKKRAAWDGACEDTRGKLLRELQKYISPSLMIPENRLRTLIDQAFGMQIQNCMYHNVAEDNFSLFVDHVCTKNQIPRETKSILEAHLDEVWHLQFSNGGDRLATASKDKTAIIWDLTTASPSVLHVLEGHADSLSFLSWSPDDTKLLTCGNDNTVHLWDTVSGLLLKRFMKHTDAVTSCAWFPDNKTFVSGGLDKNIIMWDTDGNDLYIWYGSRINDLAVSADGKTMVAINSDKKIIIYDLENEDQPQPVMIPESESITSLYLSKDGKHLLVNISSQEIHVWDLKERKCLQKYEGQKQGRFVIRSAFGGRGQAFIVSGSEDSQVYIWHKQSGALLEVLAGHAKTVNAVAWNPKDPHMFASASDDGTVRIWGCSDENSGDAEAKISRRRVLKAWEEP